MTTPKNFSKVLFIFVSSVLMLAACGSIPELKVHYQLPQGSERLAGKQLALSFEDSRTDRNLIGKGAQEDFKNFSGKLSFSFARYKESGFKIGLYDLPDLLKEVFKRRLENDGLKVVSGTSPGTPELRIVLRDLMLDLSGRTWIASMRYDARVFLEGREAATQSVSGQAERAKVVGTSGADAVMGELFTDMVNRLDVVRLLTQAQKGGS